MGGPVLTLPAPSSVSVDRWGGNLWTDSFFYIEPSHLVLIFYRLLVPDDGRQWFTHVPTWWEYNRPLEFGLIPPPPPPSLPLFLRLPLSLSPSLSSVPTVLYSPGVHWTTLRDEHQWVREQPLPERGHVYWWARRLPLHLHARWERTNHVANFVHIRFARHVMLSIGENAGLWIRIHFPTGSVSRREKLKNNRKCKNIGNKL